MDKNLHDKKWFVYLNDHHEGPFSVAEIFEKKTSGVVMSSTHYVWCEGMKDWVLMDEVPDFKETPKPQIAPPPQLVTRETPSAFLEPSALIEVQTGLTTRPPVVALESTTEPPVEFEAPLPVVDTVPVDTILEKPSFLQRYRRSLRAVAVLVILVSAGLIAYPYLDRIPWVADLVSPIAPHPEIEADDLSRMRTAARVPIDTFGPKVAMAISKDRMKPMVFVGTNLPDGTKLILRVEGLKGTLLNQTVARAQIALTVHKRYVASGVLQLDSGRMLPQGDYMLYLTDAPSDQPTESQEIFAKLPVATVVVPGAPEGRKVVETRAAFFGGIKDSIYIDRLKKYHDDLKIRARNELMELGQLYQTLLNQSKEAVQTYERLRKVKPSKLGKQWASFHAKWSALVDSMMAEFKQWTAERLKAERFYYPLFALSKDAAEKLQLVQRLQDQRILAGAAATPAMDLEIDAQRSNAQSVLKQLDEQIKKAQALLDSPDGVPELPDNA